MLNVVASRQNNKLKEIKMIRKIFLAIAIIVMMIFTLSPAWAGSATSSSVWTVTLQNSCMIGTVGNLTADFNGLADVTGNVNVGAICSNALPWTLTIGNGANASGGVRRATSSGNYVSYRLYSDSGRSTEIGVGTNNTLTDTGTGVEQTKTLYTAVKKADNNGMLVNGTYIDTILLTVNW